MSDTLFESYTPTETDHMDLFGVNWGAETFTTIAAHSITSIKLKLARVGGGGLPGTCTVSIRATLAGVPFGADLTSATFNGNALTGTSTLTELTGLSTSVTDATVYAIVLRAPSGDGSNILRVGYEGGYSGGSKFASADSGATWGAPSASQWIFQIYGILTPGAPIGRIFAAKQAINRSNSF